MRAVIHPAAQPSHPKGGWSAAWITAATSSRADASAKQQDNQRQARGRQDRDEVGGYISQHHKLPVLMHRVNTGAHLRLERAKAAGRGVVPNRRPRSAPQGLDEIGLRQDEAGFGR